MRANNKYLSPPLNRRGRLGLLRHVRVTADELGRLGGAGLTGAAGTLQLDRNCNAAGGPFRFPATSGGGSAKRHCGSGTRMREGCCWFAFGQTRTGPDPRIFKMARPPGGKNNIQSPLDLSRDPRFSTPRTLVRRRGAVARAFADSTSDGWGRVWLAARCGLIQAGRFAPSRNSGW